MTTALNLQLTQTLRDRRIVLASTSPRRRELLSTLGFAFKCVAPSFEEDMSVEGDPVEVAEAFALGKAESVEAAQDTIVIAGDTFASLEGRLLGKPHSPEKAVEYLLALEGTTHQLHSGWVVWSQAGARISSGVVASNVTLSPMNQSEIEAYVATGEPLDKAGAYALQGLGSVFVQHIEGSITAIVGLPLPQVYDALVQHSAT